MQLTAKQIEARLRDQVGKAIEQEKWGIAAHTALANVLAKWKGKKLNKRVATQFAETFMPDPVAREKAVCVWSDRWGSYYEVELWGIGPWPGHGEHLSMTVAYHTKPTEPRIAGAWVQEYDPASFEQTDACHGEPAKERNAARLALCQDTGLADIAKAVVEVRDAYARLESLIAHDTLGGIIRYKVQDIVKELTKD